jgi:hypothetical protein
MTSGLNVHPDRRDQRAPFLAGQVGKGHHGLTRELVEERVVGVEGLHFCPDLAALVG